MFWKGEVKRRGRLERRKEEKKDVEEQKQRHEKVKNAPKGDKRSNKSETGDKGVQER